MNRRIVFPVALVAMGIAASFNGCSCSGEARMGNMEAKQPPPPPPPAPPPPPPAPPPPPPVEIKTVGKAKIEGDQIKIPGQVEFDVDKSTIRDTPQTKEVLNTLADVLKQNATVTKLRIEGHTDNTGAADHNMKLSQGRADAVKKWLVDHGVDAKRLEAQGFGMTKPDFPNDTADNKQKNRRTEFHLAEMEGKAVHSAGSATDPNAPKVDDKKATGDAGAPAAAAAGDAGAKAPAATGDAGKK